MQKRVAANELERKRTGISNGTVLLGRPACSGATYALNNTLGVFLGEFHANSTAAVAALSLLVPSLLGQTSARGFNVLVALKTLIKARNCSDAIFRREI